ncbi:MAG: 16S rRNA (uracil(1498)-N(3))-methyltransferase [Gammaproteobacteria bacterium]
MRETRIYVDQNLASGAICRLPEEAAHHLATVLRMKTGQSLIMFNGRGGSYRAVISRMEKRNVEVSIGAHEAEECESPLSITLAQAIMRGQHMDYALQKAVELGVQRIVPLLCRHGNVKLDHDQRQHRLDHWTKIIISACEQCGRNRIPQLSATMHLAEWVGMDENDVKLILHPRNGVRLASLHSTDTSLTLLVGPEGGFSDEEVAAADRHGYRAVTLGPRILRAESAALVAISACQTLWGDV